MSNLAIEALVESRIQKIDYDGTESYTTQSSRTEIFSKNTEKIDFKNRRCDLNIDNTVTKLEKKNDQDTDSCGADVDETTHNKLRTEETRKMLRTDQWKDTKDSLYKAFEEVSVLCDVLKIATESNKPKSTMNYIDFNHIEHSEEPNQNQASTTVSATASLASAASHHNQAAQMVKTQHALQAASKMLSDGSVQIKSESEKLNRIGLQGAGLDFHQELLKLKQFWRLRTVTNSRSTNRTGIRTKQDTIIIGDVGLSSIGSGGSRQEINFEVIKKIQALEDIKAANTRNSSRESVGGKRKLSAQNSKNIDEAASVEANITNKTEPIEVRIPGELKRRSYLEFKLFTSQKKSPQSQPGSTSAPISSKLRSSPARISCFGSAPEILQNGLTLETNNTKPDKPKSTTGNSSGPSSPKKPDLTDKPVQVQPIYILPTWQIELCHAQNIVWTQDLLASINSRAMANLEMVCPIISSSNGFQMPIMPGVSLKVELTEIIDENKMNTHLDATEYPLSGISSDYVLRHFTGMLVRRNYQNNISVCEAKPTVAILGPTNQGRMAEISGSSLYELQALNEQHNKSVLQKILSCSKFLVLCRRIENALNNLGNNDPVIIAHWPSITNYCSCEIKVVAASPGHDVIYRSAVQLFVNGDTGIQAIHKEGNVEQIGETEAEIEALLKQICITHHQMVSQVVGRAFGWTTTQIPPNGNIFLSNPDMNFCNGGVNLTSPLGKPIVTVIAAWKMPRVFITSHNKLKQIKSRLDENGDNDEAVWPMRNLLDSRGNHSNTKWSCLPGHYREVDLSRIMGGTFLHKLETILACLNQIPNI